jgi:hypothetical protein
MEQNDLAAFVLEGFQEFTDDIKPEVAGLPQPLLPI